MLSLYLLIRCAGEQTARISLCMKTYQSGAKCRSLWNSANRRQLVRIPESCRASHGSMGAGSYWMGRFAPTLSRLGIAAYAPRYLQKTGSLLGDIEKDS